MSQNKKDGIVGILFFGSLIAGWFEPGFFIITVVTFFMLAIRGGEDLEKQRIQTLMDVNDTFEAAGFDSDKKYYEEGGLSSIAMNEDSLMVLNRKDVHSPFRSRIIPFNDLLEVKLIEDGATVIQTSKAGMVGGALVGGLVSGGFGAVIGAAGANKTSNTKVKRISLELVVDDLDSPTEYVDFMNEPVERKKEDERYKKAFEKANHWYRVCGVLLKRNENNKNIN